VNLNSAGLPDVTVTVAERTVLWCAPAGSAHASGAHTATSASNPIRYRTIV
jgi:hypothetical protein